MLKHVAVIGATGAVGRELLRLIHDRKLPIGKLSALASNRSVGTVLRVGDRDIPVQRATREILQDVSLTLFSAGASVSRELAGAVVDGGGVVVDNSSAFRMDPNVPLVIPEINADDLKRHNGIIANPNCSTIIMLMAIGPIHAVFPIRRIVVSTYQSASGAGQSAMNELREQTRNALDDRPIHPVAFKHPIAFNLFSHDSDVGDDGYNGEEQKMIDETRKILHTPDLPISATCVRVPVLRAHSESINLEFVEPTSAASVREVLSGAPGVRVVDDRAANHFPMPVDATKVNDVLVGRIRQDISVPDDRGVELFVCGDQLLKGAALNAIQIAEHLEGG